MGSTHFSRSSGGYVVSDMGVCMYMPGVMVTDRIPWYAPSRARHLENPSSACFPAQ